MFSLPRYATQEIFNSWIVCLVCFLLIRTFFVLKTESVLCFVICQYFTWPVCSYIRGSTVRVFSSAPMFYCLSVLTWISITWICSRALISADYSECFWPLSQSKTKTFSKPLWPLNATLLINVTTGNYETRAIFWSIYVYCMSAVFLTDVQAV